MCNCVDMVTKHDYALCIDQPVLPYENYPMKINMVYRYTLRYI